MNKLKTKQILAVLALLGSSIASAVTVTVVPSVVNPVAPGTNFFVTVGSPDMAATTGATLGVTWDPTVISIGTATPIGPDFNFAVFTPTGSGTGLVSVISTSASGKAGPFQAFTLALTALNPPGQPKPANLLFIDDGQDLGWSDPQANNYQGVQYQQASIIVDTPVPVPAAAWLFVSAVGGLVTLKRRQKA